MRSTINNSSRQAVHIRKISDFLLASLIFLIIILALGFLFHKGAGLAAEMLMDLDFTKPEVQPYL